MPTGLLFLHQALRRPPPDTTASRQPKQDQDRAPLMTAAATTGDPTTAEMRSPHAERVHDHEGSGK